MTDAEQLAALEEAINSGVNMIRDPSGAVVQYRSQADMERARDALRRKLGLASTWGHRLSSHSKGLE